MFPITDSRERFDDAVNNRKRLGNTSAAVRTAIEGVQPYNRPHPGLPPLLAILRDLNNADKHKLLRLAYASVTHGDIGFVGEHPQDGRIWQAIPNYGEVKDGAEIFAMVCDHPTPNMKYDRTVFDVVVAVWHGKIDPSKPDWQERNELPAVMDILIKEVRQVIYIIEAVVN